MIIAIIDIERIKYYSAAPLQTGLTSFLALFGVLLLTESSSSSSARPRLRRLLFRLPSGRMTRLLGYMLATCIAISWICCGCGTPLALIMSTVILSMNRCLCCTVSTSPLVRARTMSFGNTVKQFVSRHSPKQVNDIKSKLTIDNIPRQATSVV